MQTYIILTRFGHGAFRDRAQLREVARAVSDKIKSECHGLEWKGSYATLGRYDVVDIVESSDPTQVERAALIIRGLGNCTTETLIGSSWKDFLARL